MITVEPILKESAVELTCTFKIKRDIFAAGTVDLLIRDAIRARLMRTFNKELDDLYYEMVKENDYDFE